MNSYFEVSPTICLGVSYPDKTIPVRTPRPTITVAQTFSAQPSDFGMSWQSIYPDVLQKLRPIYPARIGVVDPAIFFPAGAPTGWLPTYLTYRDAPRLHQTFPRTVFDPASGQFGVVAQQMAWDPRQKAPFITRSRLKETTAFFYTRVLDVPAPVSVAQQMVWDPKQKVPLVTRPRLHDTTAFFYVSVLDVPIIALTCTAMADLDLRSPTILADVVTTPMMITMSLTTPTMLNEGIC